MKTIDHLDAYTAPRLVEYHRSRSVRAAVVMYRMAPPMAAAAERRRAADDAARYRGVTVEANYDVGEYDVSILSATESDGLVNFAHRQRLQDSGRRRARCWAATSSRRCASSSPR